MEFEENFGNSTLAPSAHYVMIQDVTFAVFCFAAAFANFGLIYTIFRYKKMRTVPNVILANWAIGDLVCLLTAPSTYGLFAIIESVSLSRVFMCSLYELGSTAQVTTIVLAILLSIDWCLEAYFEGASTRFRKYLRYYLCALWMSTLSLLCLSVAYCVVYNSFEHLVQIIIIFIAYSGLLLFTMSAQISRCVFKCRKRRTAHQNLMLNVTTAITASWLLGFINLLIIKAVDRYYQIVDIASTTLALCTSTIIFLIMYRQNNDFHACVNNILRRDRGGYEEANFDFHAPLRKPIVKSGGQLLFNNQNNLLF